MNGDGHARARARARIRTGEVIHATLIRSAVIRCARARAFAVDVPDLFDLFRISFRQRRKHEQQPLYSFRSSFVVVPFRGRVSGS